MWLIKRRRAAEERAKKPMLVSAIMPTFNRRHLIGVALASYAAQDWPERQLIVFDDGEMPVEDLLVGVPNVIYLRHRQGKLSTGVKRNVCCEAASGEVIVHFDDDDWSAPGRITDQVTRLVESGKQMSGYRSLYYWSMTLQKAFRYDGSPNYSCGTAMCYRKEFWATHRFPDKAFAEDNHVVFMARDEGQIIAVPGFEMLVVRAHANTTSSDQRIGHNEWPEVQREALPTAFFPACA